MLLQAAGQFARFPGQLCDLIPGPRPDPGSAAAASQVPPTQATLGRRGEIQQVVQVHPAGRAERMPVNGPFRLSAFSRWQCHRPGTLQRAITVLQRQQHFRRRHHPR